MDTGEVLVRKVSLYRFRRKPERLNEPLSLRLPRGIEIANMLKTFKVKDPDHPPLFAKCLLHEYILGQGPVGEPRYSSVLYWKLCNGGTVYRKWIVYDAANEPALPPVGMVARMIR
ncbi:hypothetical protein B0H67DRAFT_561144 [Lasiosphaeris hirsuta]|uniref:Uncharacterized protein n=1 Tax=Lasiosphaeris hirsuta TaxID=260670 RepID=A0AA40ECE7_9PEZI|nr:hypothetical protein B0H67DRAFT_561144 [Lasiosphaeris hirsuta]